MRSTTQKYCRDLVRKCDVDGYLIGLLFPSPLRLVVGLIHDSFSDAYFAIRGFNVEIANIKDSAAQSASAAQGRYAWWMDAICDMYLENKIVRHPIMEELSIQVKQHSLSRHWIESIVDCRLKENQGRFPESMDDLETYAEKSISSQLYLILETMGCTNVGLETRSRSINLEQAISHVGVSYGLCIALRGISRVGISAIPDAVRHKHGYDSVACMFDIASLAYSHLLACRSNFKLMATEEKKKFIYPLLLAINSDIILDNLRTAQFSVKMIEKDLFRTQVRLLWAGMTNDIEQPFHSWRKKS